MEDSQKHPEWLEKAAKTLLDHCNKDCDEKRKFMLPIWKRADYYWNDIQDLFWDASANDWRTFDSEEGETEIDAIKDSNQIINSYRAFGESIIAAATIGNLSIRFFPEDADSILDLEKSRSFSDKSDYIQRVNNIKDLRRKAFMIRWNQGQVASYVTIEKDKERFGSYNRNVVSDQKSLILNKKCSSPECGAYIPSQRIDAPEDFASAVPPEPESCPECGASVTVKQSEETTSKVIGTEVVERECAAIHIFSPLQFKIPFYATKPEEVNYVIIEGEIHYATLRSLYPDYAKEIHPAGNSESLEAIERTQADKFSAGASLNLNTLSRAWFAPDLYWIFMTDDETDTTFDDLNQMYPNGFAAHFVGDNLLVECANEPLKERWSFVRSPLDTHIYIRALGNAMIPIQDMENDLVFITMDTIRHAIGETFYDGRIINQKVYGKLRAQPGAMFPLNIKDSNRAISDYFHSTKNASLSQEVDRFHERLESRGQLVTGAFPSIYGGQFGEGSKTLGVYELSRAQALQRITIPANGIDDFLTETIAKATVLYDKNMQNDESYSVEDGNVGYKNVTLTKSVPGASIARVETVKSEQFPTTWEQKRAFIMELLDKQVDMANPIAATIFSAENLSVIGRIIGIPELKVPGEADRNKQLWEIQELLNTKPIMPQMPPMMDPAMVQEPIQPLASMPPDFDVDNDQVHIDTIISWAVSPIGIKTKKNNPKGYENVMLHLRAHKNNQMMKMQEAQTPPPTDDEGNEGDENNDTQG